MKRYLLLAIVGLSFITVQFDIKKVVDKLTAYSLKNPQEKIFIHFDKPNYSTGETIWFKSYLVDAYANEPITISKVIYVELLNSALKPINQKTLRVEKGGAAGEFLLPDSLSPGTYHVRAYSNWMRNSDEAFFYRNSFKVLKTQVEEESSNPSIEPRVAFFPEGGDLIDGVASIVAVKATDQFGNGIVVNGTVKNSEGADITTFETDERGFGALIVTPNKKEQLTSETIFNQQSYAIELPEVKESGYAIRVLNNYQSEKITITVTAKNKSLAGSGLVAHHSGEVFYSVLNEGDDEAFAVRLDRNDFPSGICHITFFDPDGIPQAERLLYANYPRTKEVSLGKNDSYGNRAAVSLEIGVRDSLIGNIASNLSVSITPQDLVQYPEFNENIVNYLMFTSDLVGTVVDPGYYLQKNKASFRSMDLLLMTQGWRRFNWEEVLTYDEKGTPNFWAEDGIIFSGQVMDYFKRDLPRESQVSLSILDNQLGFVQGETDEQGRFFFSGNDFYDSTDLLFQAKRKLKKDGKFRNDVFIELDQQAKPTINNSFFTPFPSLKPEKKETYLVEKEKMEKIERAFNFDKDAIMLDAVEVTGTKVIVNDPFESPFKIYGEPTGRIVADSIMRGVAMISIFDLFRRLPGVRVFGSFPNQSIQIGGPGSINSSTDPLYLLDGINISAEVVNSIPPTSVSHVDILDRADAAIYGSQGANGVVAIYSKTGLGVTDKEPKNMGILNHSHPGYTQVREFFSPNYEVPLDIHAKPDFRTTLYWNPTLILEGDSTSTAVFYTSDQKGKFDVIIQGITVDGTPVFLRDTLVVE
ncbi:TonB-dependent receptor plug domain-containing protein [Ekhidna sp.]|uniref:TonB-dependent receptor plug domain-containing protein n=1 Tax=Ekhidna sp. TaxID=2608089 RepID=UPI003BA8E8E5